MAKQKRKFETARTTYAESGFVGAGGTAEVLKVTDDEGKEFALKLLHAGLPSQKTRRFIKEVHFCSRTDHRHIVRVLDEGVHLDGDIRRPFCTMPLYGSTVRKLLNQGIPTELVLGIFDQILSGVEAAHLLGVVHRDLKPENLLYDPITKTVVVADFGIAQFSEDSLVQAVVTGDQEKLANFQYAAPEQRQRGGNAGVPADIYALGLILNEFFTGVIPLGADYRKISEVASQYAYLDRLVNEMIQNEAGKRIKSVAEIKRRLIGYGNDFVQMQNLDRLKKTVIPESDVDDPLIRNPIGLVEVDYRSGGLFFILSAAPSNQWIMYFCSGTVEHFRGYAPENFAFKGNTATVPAPQQEVIIPEIIERFKRFIIRANQLYKAEVETAHSLRIVQERRLLEKQIADRTAEEARRQRILAQVKM